MRAPVPYGKYILLDRVSVGGMAEVFKAKSFGVEGFEKVIAIKRILPSMGEDPDFIDMFIDEAKIAGQLAHANICQIFELGRVDGSHFIAMEYIWGKDLLQIANRFRKLRQRMPVPMACFVLAKVCEGLDHAHRKRDPMGQKMNIVHRDCSPQNVLISYEGEVKLIDFGIAKAASRSSKTVAGVLKGKFGYMSPEQVRGLALDRRSDIFAVGTVLYECVTGERLFQCESDFSTLEKVRNVAIFPPSHYNKSIEPELERVVMKALARNPDERYQWAGELQRDLQQLLMKQERVFTAKQLGTWLKQAFAVEVARERKLMEKYKQVGPDGKPRSTTTESGRTLPVYPESAPAAPAGGYSDVLNRPARGKSQTGEFDEGPTEVFGELTVDREAEQEVLVSQEEAAPRSRPATMPPPVPGAAGPAPLPIAEEPTVAKVVVHDRSSRSVPAPLLEVSGTDRMQQLLASTDEMASFGSTAAVTPIPAPGTGVRTRRRKGILKDVGIGLGIAAAVLVIFAGVKILFFGDAPGPKAAQAAPAGTIAVTVPDQKPAAVHLNGEPVGKVAGGDALKLGDLTPGIYEVRVRRAGVDDCVRSIDLTAGAIEIASCTFAKRAPAQAKLTLEGSLEGAVVFLDGQEISAQAAREPLLLAPGQDHEVMVKREGASDVVFAVTLAAGDSATRTVPEPVALVDEAAERRRAARKAARALERDARNLTDSALKTMTKGSGSKKTSPEKVSAKKTDTEPTPKADDEPKKPEDGFLIAWTTPWARVWIDGKDTGKTTPIAPRAKIALAPGKHKVTFVVGTEKFSYPVVIESGAVKKLRKELPLKATP